MGMSGHTLCTTGVYIEDITWPRRDTNFIESSRFIG